MTKEHKKLPPMKGKAPQKKPSMFAYTELAEDNNPDALAITMTLTCKQGDKKLLDFSYTEPI